jgi:hypothetical protein
MTRQGAKLAKSSFVPCFIGGACVLMLAFGIRLDVVGEPF